MKNRIRFWDAKGYSIWVIEALVVGAIIVSALWPSRTSHGGHSITEAATQLDDFKTALAAYQLDTGRYPASLHDLIAKPGNITNWHGPYLEKIPLNPWGSTYVYKSPGAHHRDGYDLSTIASDGHILSNWTD